MDMLLSLHLLAAESAASQHNSKRRVMSLEMLQNGHQLGSEAQGSVYVFPISTRSWR